MLYWLRCKVPLFQSQEFQQPAGAQASAGSTTKEPKWIVHRSPVPPRIARGRLSQNQGFPWGIKQKMSIFDEYITRQVWQHVCYRIFIYVLALQTYINTGSQLYTYRVKHHHHWSTTTKTPLLPTTHATTSRQKQGPALLPPLRQHHQNNATQHTTKKQHNQKEGKLLSWKNMSPYLPPKTPPNHLLNPPNL